MESNCRNCKALDESHSGQPAVPIGGTCNTFLHVCPNDGTRWWQMNSYYHLWQQVTSDEEWATLQEWQQSGNY